MYVGVGNGQYDLLYEDASIAKDLALIDPVLTLEESKAGSFRTTIPPTHPLYSNIEKRRTEFRVYKSGEMPTSSSELTSQGLLWKGIVLSEDYDFYKQRQVVVEGPLAYLNDTMQVDQEFVIASKQDIWDYMDAVLNRHNAKTGTARHVYLGNVNVEPNQTARKLVDNLQPYKLTLTRDTSTKQALDNLLSQYGGYFYVTYEDAIESVEGSTWVGYPIPKVHYLRDFTEISEGSVIETSDRPICDQTIIFSKSLLNLTRTVSMDDIATVIVPLGANDDDGNPITIVSDDHPNDYVLVSQELFNKYGWIEKVVKWPDIENKATLLELAEYYATNLQFFDGDILDLGTQTLNITALDVKYLDTEIDAIGLSEKVRVYSVYHDIEQFYPCQKIEIHMASPENTIISLGQTAATSRSISTSVSDIKPASTEDTSGGGGTDWSQEIADLQDQIDQITDWASMGGYDPTVDGFLKGCWSMEYWSAADPLSKYTLLYGTSRLAYWTYGISTPVTPSSVDTYPVYWIASDPSHVSPINS